jgi:hypothetical protein
LGKIAQVAVVRAVSLSRAILPHHTKPSTGKPVLHLRCPL